MIEHTGHPECLEPSTTPKRIIMNGLPGLNLRLWLTYLEKQQDVSTTFVCHSNGAICQTTKEAYPGIRVMDIGCYRRNPLALFWEIFRGSYDLLLIQGLYSFKLNLLLFVLVRAQKKFVIIWNVSSHQKIAIGPNQLENRLHRWMLQRSDGILFTWKPTQDGFVKMFPDIADKTACFNWGFSDEYFDLDFAPHSELTDRMLADVGSKDILLFFPRLIRPYHRHDVFIRALPIVKEKLSPQLWSRVRVIILGGECSPVDAKPLVEIIAHTNLSNIKFHWGDYIDRDYMWRLYNRANVFINLSNENTQPGGAIYEAVARKTCLILSDNSAYRHLRTLGYDVALVENEPTAVAEALCEAIKTVDRGSNNESIEKNRKLVKTMFDESRFGIILSHCLGQD